MTSKTYGFLDNGVSGSLAVIHPDGSFFYSPIPVKSCLNYQKKKANITRIDTIAFKALLEDNLIPKDGTCLLLLERPMVNPGRFNNSLSAVRALEATLIVIESLNIPHMFVDSKEWQSAMLPGNVASDQLKTVSKQVALRLFPTAKLRTDGDSLLGAEWARRKQL